MLNDDDSCHCLVRTSSISIYCTLRWERNCCAPFCVCQISWKSACKLGLCYQVVGNLLSKGLGCGIFAIQDKNQAWRLKITIFKRNLVCNSSIERVHLCTIKGLLFVLSNFYLKLVYTEQNTVLVWWKNILCTMSIQQSLILIPILILKQSISAMNRIAKREC